MLTSQSLKAKYISKREKDLMFKKKTFLYIEEKNNVYITLAWRPS